MSTAGVWLVAIIWPAALFLVLLFIQRTRAVRQEKILHGLQADLRALCNAAVGVGERVGSLERRQRELVRQQETLGLKQDKLKQEAPVDPSYAQALKLARKGASVEDLVEVCGLPRGEAELVAMMHRLANS